MAVKCYCFCKSELIRGLLKKGGKWLPERNSNSYKETDLSKIYKYVIVVYINMYVFRLLKESGDIFHRYATCVTCLI